MNFLLILVNGIQLIAYYILLIKNASDNSAIHNHHHIQMKELPSAQVLYSKPFNAHDWQKPFPFDKAKIMENLNEENLRRIFKNKLPKAFIKVLNLIINLLNT